MLSSNETTFLHLFFGSNFMTLMIPIDMFEQHITLNPITSKVHFVKGLANYIGNMTLTNLKSKRGFLNP